MGAQLRLVRDPSHSALEMPDEEAIVRVLAGETEAFAVPTGPEAKTLAVKAGMPTTVKVEKPEPAGLDAAAESVEITLTRGPRSVGGASPRSRR